MQILITATCAVTNQLKKSTLNVLKVFSIFSILLFLTACSDSQETASPVDQNERSLTEFDLNLNNALTSRSSIVATPTPMVQLTDLLSNPAINISKEVVLVDGQSITQTVELQDLTISTAIDVTLENSVSAGNYQLTLNIRVDDASYGSTIVTTTDSIETNLNDLQTNLAPISLQALQFPDDDQDGLSNMAEVLAGTDFNDPESLPLPGIPNHVNVMSNNNDIKINWDPVDSADHYNIYLAVVAGNAPGNWVTYNNNTPSITIDNVLSADAINVYAVVSAVNAAGEGMSSPQAALNETATVANGNISINALPPTITKIKPAADAFDVEVSQKIKVVYDPLPSITNVWLEVTGVVPVSGSISESTGKIKFVPDSLDYSTTYTAKATLFELDASGNTVEYQYEWSFTTMAEPIIAADTTPPRVSGISPATDDVDIDSASDINISFTEEIDDLTLDAGVIIDFVGGGNANNRTSVTGRWGTRTNTAVFTPANTLPADTTIWVTVEAVADLAGNRVQSRFGSSFRTAPNTGAGTGAGNFTLVKTNPIDGDTNVSVRTPLEFIFSLDVDMVALQQTSSIMIYDSNSNPVAGTWLGQGKTAIFRPTNDLQMNGTYIVQINDTVMSLTGGSLLGGPRSIIFYTETLVVDPLVWNTSNPMPDEINVPINTLIELNFMRPVDLNTVMARDGVQIEDRNTRAMLTGNWVSNGNSILFTPDAPLNYATDYRITILTGVTDLNGVAIASKQKIKFTTETSLIVDAVAPTWMGATPGMNEANISINATIIIKFDEPIDVASVENHTGIRIHGPSGATIAGEFKSEGNRIEFEPQLPMTYDSQYVVYLTTITKDMAGNALDLGVDITNTNWIFYTETQAIAPVSDTTPPQLLSQLPVSKAVDVDIATLITSTFSEPIDPASIQNHSGIRIEDANGITVAGTWLTTGNDVIFAPDVNLLEGALYVISITTGIRDLNGNALTLPTHSSFTTKALIINTPTDTAGPIYIGTTPNDGATNVPVTSNFIITFSEPVDLSSLVQGGISIIGATGAQLAGSWSKRGNQVIYSPSALLDYAAQYIVIISSSVRDIAGNALASGNTFVTFSFTQNAP